MNPSFTLGGTSVRQKESCSEAEQRLQVESARPKHQLVEREKALAILKRQRRTLRKTRSEVRLHGTACTLQDEDHGADAEGIPQWVLCLAQPKRRAIAAPA